MPRLIAAFALALVVGLSSLAGPVAAQTNANTAEQRALLAEAEAAVIKILAEEHLGANFKSALSRARAVFIVPQLIKGGFIFGGEGGTGVLLARLPEGGWSAPAFIIMGGASIGLQLGGQVSQVAFTIMTDKGLAAILNNKVKLGADLSVAVGVAGAGTEAATTTAAGADIYQFAVSKGLFGGGTVEGAVLEPRDAWNAAIYGGQYKTPRDIVTDRSLNPPEADSLREALSDK
jgi:lipid-binding SYLF domain-containing protein